jgi:hypothetical protein
MTLMGHAGSPETDVGQLLEQCMGQNDKVPWWGALF